MGLKDEDIDFDRRVNDKRHKELIASLKGIADEVKKEKKDTAVIIAIEKQLSEIKKLSESVANIPKPDTPNVNVEMNQQDVIASIGAMTEKILSGLEDIKQYLMLSSQPKQFEFKINRNVAGYIDSVVVKDVKPKINAQA